MTAKCKTHQYFSMLNYNYVQPWHKRHQNASHDRILIYSNCSRQDREEQRETTQHSVHDGINTNHLNKTQIVWNLDTEFEKYLDQTVRQ